MVVGGLWRCSHTVAITRALEGGGGTARVGASQSALVHCEEHVARVAGGRGACMQHTNSDVQTLTSGRESIPLHCQLYRLSLATKFAQTSAFIFTHLVYHVQHKPIFTHRW